MTCTTAFRQARPFVAGLDFPPALPPSKSDIYDLLVANRFAEAEHGARAWPLDNEARRLIEAGRYQQAISELSLILFPRLAEPFPMYVR